MTIQIDVRKNFGDFSLDLHLQADNEVMGLLGASGSGKSMTLKCIAGIEKPDDGCIILNEKVLFDSQNRINLPPQERRVGYMFQNYALFPQMTVLDNIRMGARREKNAALKKKKVAEIMERFEITDLSHRYPSQISGGQQQRTALARILVSDPEILLLDEPFSALDTHLRFRLERELREVARDFRKTVILVSHDRDETFRLADKIAILSNGKLDVCGDKADVFRDPSTRQAAILTGCKNISGFTANGAQRIHATDWDISLDFIILASACTIFFTATGRMRRILSSSRRSKIPSATRSWCAQKALSTLPRLAGRWTKPCGRACAQARLYYTFHTKILCY